MNSERVPSKVCSRCGVLKPLTNYHYHNKKAGTLRGVCKDCRCDQNKQLYQKNYVRIREQQKQYYQEHREERLAYKKQYYQNNRDKILTKQKQYAQEHCDAIQAYQRQYRQNNLLRLRAQQRAYYYINHDRIREQRKQYHKHRYQTDPAYRRTVILRSRLKSVVNKINTIDPRKTLALVGCSSDWFNLWLKYTKNFYCPFSLNTHVDHVYPMSSYNILDSKESRLAMDWKNLRVINAGENMGKGKSRPTVIVIQTHQQLIFNFYYFMRRCYPSVPY